MSPDNIILMSDDKVTTMKQNPFPGQLFTDDSPDVPGKDYAKGCIEHIDYHGANMNIAVLAEVLMGDVERLKKLTKMEHPRALHSTADDDVIIYFTSFDIFFLLSRIAKRRLIVPSFRGRAYRRIPRV